MRKQKTIKDKLESTMAEINGIKDKVKEQELWPEEREKIEGEIQILRNRLKNLEEIKKVYPEEVL